MPTDAARDMGMKCHFDAAAVELGAEHADEPVDCTLPQSVEVEESDLAM